MNTHIRTFLERVLPWPADDQPTAFRSIHWTFEPKKPTKPLVGGKPPMGGAAVRSIDEAVETVERQNRNPTSRDIYVCLATQKTAVPKAAKNGREYLAPVRDHTNALELKSLFMDIDVKPDAYPTQKAAILAFKHFLAMTGMPRPTLFVESGTGGMHAYWCLDRALTVTEWQPLADALVEAARSTGLKFDSQCTIDSVRIMRVPGTLNYKNGETREVRLSKSILPTDYTVEEIKKVLKPVMSMYSPRAPLPGVSDLAAGIHTEARPVVLDTVLPNCGFLAEAVTSGGDRYDNTLWNLTTLIATFCEDGREEAHRMAKDHPAYTEAETDALYDRKLREREQKDLGWPRCKTIHNSGCSHCAVCPNFAKNLSPLHFGVGVGAAVEDPTSDLPHGFVRTAAGIIQKLIPGEGGAATLVPISTYPVMDGWIQTSPWAIHFTTRLETGAKRKIRIEAEILASNDLGKVLSRQGVFIQSGDLPTIRSFLVAWAQKLQQTKSAIVRAIPFGWSEDGDGTLEGFSFGGRLWTSEGDRPAAAPDSHLGGLYQPVGALDPWKAAARMITDQQRPALDLVLAVAFGAPLMRFSGHTGVVMSAFSFESGIGKSTAMAIGQAVWGHPVRGVQSLGDTSNAVSRKLGDIRSLPVFWDEIKTEQDTANFVRLAFQLSLGKDKSRLNANADYKPTGSWETMLLVASNDSIVDYVARGTRSTTAGINRVFEWTVTPGVIGQIGQGPAQRMVAELRSNYGNAGQVYAEYLGANHEKVKAAVAKTQDAFVQATAATAEERFWIAGMACCFVGAALANQLGLTQFELRALKAFLFEALEKMRGDRAKQPVDLRNPDNVAEVLGRFLNDARARHTLVTNRMPMGTGRPIEVAVLSDRTRLESLWVQIARDQGIMRIHRQAFDDWIIDKRLSLTAVKEGVERVFGATLGKMRLGSGTDLATAQLSVWDIDLRSPAVVKYLGALVPEPEDA